MKKREALILSVCTLVSLLLRPALAKPQEPIRATTEDGKQVLLNPDGTWRFFETGSSQYQRSPSATQKIKAPFGDFAVWIDPSKWRQSKSDTPVKLTFEKTSGNGYAMVIAESIPVSTDSVREIAVTNLRSADANGKVIREERRTVNGHEVLCLQMEASPKNIPFTFYGYYYGGTSGYIQVVTFTATSAFAQVQPELTEFLNGLEIDDKEFRPTQSAGPENLSPGEPNQLSLSDGKFTLPYDSQKWKEKISDRPGRKQLEHVKGEGFALIIAEGLQVPLDSLPDIVLTNAQHASADAKIIFREKKVVNGVEVWHLKTQATLKGIPFTYDGYYYGGKAGTLQLITYTGTSLFDQYEKDFSELLSGLHIKE
jgi:hypothetical protein